MQLYLDTANLEIIKKFHRTLPLQGVTTNPSILAKEKQPVVETLQAIQQIIGENGQLFAQTLGRSAQENDRRRFGVTRNRTDYRGENSRHSGRIGRY